MRVRDRARIRSRIRVRGLGLVPMKVALMILVERSANDHSMKSLVFVLFGRSQPYAVDTEAEFEVG